MKRWAVACKNILTVIPPHPSQLSDLLGVTTAAEKQVSIFSLPLPLPLPSNEPQPGPGKRERSSERKCGNGAARNSDSE